MKKIIACISIICYTLLCYSQNQTTDNNYRTQKNISYLHPGEKDSYKLERCKLDLHSYIIMKERGVIKRSP